MSSKRRHEGLVTIDHTNSPGLTPEQVKGFGPVVPGGQLYESATVTCCHCQAIVILNPLRTRPRNYCAKCDHYHCDGPACFTCVPFQKVVDDILESAVQAIQRGIQRISW